MEKILVKRGGLVCVCPPPMAISHQPELPSLELKICMGILYHYSTYHPFVILGGKIPFDNYGYKSVRPVH